MYTGLPTPSSDGFTVNVNSLAGALPLEAVSTGAGLVGALGQLAIRGVRRANKLVRGGKKITAKELGDALKETPLPKLAENLKHIKDDTVRKAVEDELRDTGEKAARGLGVDLDHVHPDRLRELALAAKAAAGAADLAGSAQGALEQAGVELSQEDRRTLRALQLGLDPTDARTGKVLEEELKDKANWGRDRLCESRCRTRRAGRRWTTRTWPSRSTPRSSAG